MKDKRIKLAFLSLPQRTRAVMEYFTSNDGQGAFFLSPEEQSDVAVFDFDNPESRSHWERYHKKFGKLGILLSVDNQQLPHTVWVQKPVTTESMMAVAVKIGAGAANVKQQKSPVANAASNTMQASVSKSKLEAESQLKLAILSLPQRTQAVMEFFMTNDSLGTFLLSEEGKSDVAVFDFDTHESMLHWQRYNANQGKPGILLSVTNQQLPMTVWVQKPVTTDSMLEAAGKIRAAAWYGAQKKPLVADPAPKAKSEPKSRPAMATEKKQVAVPELKLATLSLPQRTQAVMEYFLNNEGRDKFTLSPEEKSDVAVFDFDNPESLLHWQRYHTKLAKPGILLSVANQQLPMTVWVQKPVTTESMLDAAGKIRVSAWLVGAAKQPAVAVPAPKILQEPKPQSKPAQKLQPKAAPAPETKQVAMPELKLATLSLPQRTQAVLEFFINNDGRDKFFLSPEEKSDVAVFDFDNPESLLHWKHYHAKQGKPGILLSVANQQLAMTVWVQKPVTTESMLEAAGKIRASAWHVEPKIQPVVEPVPKAKPETATKPKLAAEPLPKPTAEPVPVLVAEAGLKLSTLSLPQRTQAVMEFFINNEGREKFILAPDEMSDVAVFDFDNPESLLHWKRYHAKQGKPGILLSVANQQLPLTVWVQKPVTTESMLAAAVKISASAWYVEPKKQPVAEPVPKAKPETLTKPKLATEPQPKLEAEPEPKRAATPDPKLAVGHELNLIAESQSDAQHKQLNSQDAERGVTDAPAEKRVWLERLTSVFSRESKQNESASRLESDDISNEADKISPESKISPVVETTSLPKQEVVIDTAEQTYEKVVPAPSPVISKEATNTNRAKTERPSDKASAEVMAALKIEDSVEAVPSPEELSSLAEFEVAPEYCGINEDIPVEEIPHTAELFYDHDSYLISALREAYIVGVRWRSPTRLDLDLGCIVFEPTENRAYLDFTEEALLKRSKANQLGGFKVGTVGIQEFAELQQRVDSLTCLHPFDATMWKIGLVTAKGRLPIGTNLNKVFYLKRRPDMTHLQPTPFNLRIADLWATRGASLLETSRILEIPQRYVFAFYNATLAIDLVTDDGKLRQENVTGGVFSKIIKRLRS